MPGEAIAAFAKQAEWCSKLHSPFMAALCTAIPEALDRSTLTGRRILDWDSDPYADALPMRITGGLNGLVRAGLVPELAAFYPPAQSQAERLVRPLKAALRDFDNMLQPWLDSAPQTNEVARSGVLMPGLLAIVAATALPLRLFELGSSAGLNLRLDTYGYRLGEVEIPGAIVLAPDWRGASPPSADVRVIERRGADLSPVDVTDSEARERLLAYIWPDQTTRLERSEAALLAAAADPPPIDRAEAADWTEMRVAPTKGAATVLFHSIAFQYFPAATQLRIAAHMERMGAAATASAPLAWLRFEIDDPTVGEPPTLRLKLWPDGADRLLARAHPHGASVHWLGLND